jgi:predicted metal-dependent hydrolase
MREAWDRSGGCLAEGIRLFNQGNFFQAHEAWEQAWKRAEGEEKTFYQGLIQAAVALCHVQRGNYAGAVSVYLKSWPRLARFPPVWMGIELGRFRSELRRYFAPLRTSPHARCGNCQLAETGQIAGTAQPPIIRWAST